MMGDAEFDRLEAADRTEISIERLMEIKKKGKTYPDEARLLAQYFRVPVQDLESDVYGSDPLKKKPKVETEMKAKKSKFTEAERKKIVREARAGTVTAIERKYNIPHSTVYKWAKQYGEVLVKRLGPGRLLKPEEEWLKVAKEAVETGNVEATAKKHGVSKSGLRRWVLKYKNGKLEPATVQKEEPRSADPEKVAVGRERTTEKTPVEKVDELNEALKDFGPIRALIRENTQLKIMYADVMLKLEAAELAAQ